MSCVNSTSFFKSEYFYEAATLLMDYTDKKVIDAIYEKIINYKPDINFQDIDYSIVKDLM